MSDFSKFRLVKSVDIGQNERINQLRYAPDGRRLVAACASGAAKVFDSSTCRLLCTLSPRAGPVRRAVWSPCGRIVAVGTTSGVIVLYDALMGAELRRWDAGQMVYLMAFSPCGARLLSGNAFLPTVRVWCPATARLISEINEENNGPVRSAFFLPVDGDAASVISISAAGRVSINSAVDGSPLRRFELGVDGVTAMALSPSGSRIAVHFHNRTARVFSVADGSEVSPLELGNGAIAWASDSVVIVGGDQGAVTIFDVASNAELNRVQLPAEDSMISAIAVRPDGRQVIAGDLDGSIHLLADE